MWSLCEVGSVIVISASGRLSGGQCRCCLEMIGSSLLSPKYKSGALWDVRALEVGC